MVVEVEVSEADELSTAIAGLDIEYVRTDRGVGPNRMTFAQSNDMLLSVGRMGFSATASTEIPDGSVVFGLITRAVPGGSWCGVELEAGQLFVYTPGTTFVGAEPAGLAACGCPKLRRTWSGRVSVVVGEPVAAGGSDDSRRCGSWL